MFRGKESSNRIKLSQLVQELLNFGVLGSLRLWGVGVGGWCGGWFREWGWVDGGGGWLGVAPHTCAHAHMHTHAHACMVNMIISCKWPLPLGESMGISYDVICMCECMHACACVGAPSHHPHPNTPTHPPTPQGGPPESVKIQ